MRDDPLGELGRRLARLRREKRDWSQEELSEFSLLARSYIADVEQGKRNIAFRNLYRIAKALGITVAELVDVGDQFAQQLHDK